jgi:hypothetical protein
MYLCKIELKILVSVSRFMTSYIEENKETEYQFLKIKH